MKRHAAPFWRDVRVWRIMFQLIVVAAVAALIYFLAANTLNHLPKGSNGVGFRFLSDPASFDITEKVIDFDPSQSYERAFLVGLTNTLLVAMLGIPLALLVGIVVGLGRLSSNWLVNKMATVYVETIRNTPLLVQLTIWYFGVFYRLPVVEEQIVLPGPIYMNLRGINVPWFARTSTTTVWVALVVAAAVGSYLLARWRTRRLLEIGRAGWPGLTSFGLFLIVSAVVWFVLPQSPLQVLRPHMESGNPVGGASLSPELAGVVTGLVCYTGAFIGEIVRAGIQSVSRGQVEAARALGLNGFKTMQLVIFPQALRVIIPPLTSQFLNLIKNSSLAAFIAYPDLYYVSTTILNQTGRNVETFAILIGVYLTFSLVTSAFMNIYNRTVRLVER